MNEINQSSAGGYSVSFILNMRLSPPVTCSNSNPSLLWEIKDHLSIWIQKHIFVFVATDSLSVLMVCSYKPSIENKKSKTSSFKTNNIALYIMKRDSKVQKQMT